MNWKQRKALQEIEQCALYLGSLVDSARSGRPDVKAFRIQIRLAMQAISNNRVPVVEFKDIELASTLETLEKLCVAIEQHRKSLEFSGDTPRVSDKQLWLSLARIFLPTNNGEISLREWLARRK